MRTLKSIIALSLFIFGLTLTSCSNDDKYLNPSPPIAPPIEADVENPIEHPPTMPPIEADPQHPIERPDVENPVISSPENPIEPIPTNPIEPGKSPA
ncbi:MAG: hypothetical protein MI866_08420 [Bacteroidales bacterium]|nr:hypothetical protein [Bacteroidales bacterium]